jgi:hypothetical protein
MHRAHFLVLSPVCFCMMSSCLAAVVHDFSGGDGTSNSTQYVGRAGGGWTGPFTGASENISTSYVVGNSNPLTPGGGNYLQRTYVGTDAGTTRRGTVFRRYGSNGDFDATKAHTVSFVWRADEVGSGFTSTGDYFMMFGSTGTPGSDTGVTSTWMIRYQAANEGGANALVGGNFALYNGNRGTDTTYLASNWVNSGIPVVVGTSYLFTILNDPADGGWSASIKELGGSASFQSQELGWRAAPGTTSFSVAWGAKVTGVGESLTMSLDDILIVPEPTSPALLALGGVLLTVLRRRHR